MEHLQATIAKDTYKTVVQTVNHTFLADEPQDKGGTDLAVNPLELVIGGLASCTVITLRMYINRKGWDIDEINVQIAYESNGEKAKRILSVSGEDVNEDVKKRLLLIANKCPVHKLLEKSIEIETVWEG